MATVLDTTGVVVGDELGQLKKIDLLNKQCSVFKLSTNEPLHPSRSVISISPLSCNLLSSNFLVATKANDLFIYDALTDEINEVNHNLNCKSSIIGSQCIDDQNIVIGFRNGSIYRINIEKALCSAKYKPNNKALNVLGIDEQSSEEKEEKKTIRVKASKSANKALTETANVLTILEHNWNVDTTYLTCFKACDNKLAIGGFNSDLQVFDITTGQSLFTAKSTNTDWLGIKRDIWLSGLDWLTPEPDAQPHLVVTCSRSDPCVKLYDIKERQRKPIMSVNLKSVNNQNNESNLPSLTSICALPSMCSFSSASSSIVVGTTLGRMLALELRTKLRTSKVLGSFKGFNGGSIRDIKYVRDSRTSCQIFSCSLDRFVRVHQFTKNSRLLEKKFYIKTKPTCLQPILTKASANQSELCDEDGFY